MTFGILKSRQISGEMIPLLHTSPDYSLVGEFYEDLTNAQGGSDFLCTDLETFLRKNKEGDEFGRLKNYSDEIAQMQGVSVLLAHSSRKKYIKEHYIRYGFYVKVRK